MYNLKFTSPVRPSVPTLPASSLGGVLGTVGSNPPFGVYDEECGIGVSLSSIALLIEEIFLQADRSFQPSIEAPYKKKSH